MVSGKCAKCAEWESTYQDDVGKLEHHIELQDRRMASMQTVVDAAKVAADKLFEAITLGTDIDDEERAAYRALVAAVNAHCDKYCEECARHRAEDEKLHPPRKP